MDPRLADHRAAWDRKPSVRAVYADYHRRILSACAPGTILEIGAGSGHLCESRDDVVGLDVLSAPWLDVVGDGQRLPFRSSSFDNIVMLDVLHHLPAPGAFFAEAQRVLRPHGRVVLIEPGLTPLSWLFYHFVHEEDVHLRADPLAPRSTRGEVDPFAANQAVPTLLFGRRRHRRRFHAAFPQLRVAHRRWLGLWAYPLSGGFQPWSLIPARVVPSLLRVEDAVLPVLGPLLAFRLFVVIEKCP